MRISSRASNRLQMYRSQPREKAGAGKCNKQPSGAPVEPLDAERAEERLCGERHINMHTCMPKHPKLTLASRCRLQMYRSQPREKPERVSATSSRLAHRLNRWTPSELNSAYAGSAASTCTPANLRPDAHQEPSDGRRRADKTGGFYGILLDYTIISYNSIVYYTMRLHIIIYYSRII